MAAQENVRYRPEIDGIRAIAVSLVILFHAFRDRFPGGFIGVDVFFVISGFLITTLIVERLDKDRFSLAEFYAGRFRRLLPALVLIFLFVWGMGWIALLADEYKNLGQHLASGATFTSNFKLWSETGYFEDIAEARPLLHLWSLGVEEQFYIFWPLLLIFWVRKKFSLTGFLVFGLVAAFAANVYCMQKYPAADFFLLPGRFWELMLGCALAGFELRRGRVQFPRVVADLLSASAMTALIFMAMNFQRTGAYPGLWALVPTLATLLLLICSRTGRATQWLLASRPLVLVGLISYPLYLWHWPLFSFAYITGDGVGTWGLRLFLVIATFVLAWCTWRFVETPIKNRISNVGDVKKGIIYSGIGVLAIIAALGSVTSWKEGFPARTRGYDAGQQSLLTGTRPVMSTLSNECGLPASDKHLAIWCQTQGVGFANAALIGDSHAGSLYPGLVYNSIGAMKWLVVARPGCPPLQDVVVNGDTECLRMNQIVLKMLKMDTTIKTVAMTATARLVTHPEASFSPESPGSKGTEDDLAFHGFSETIGQLMSAGKQVILILDNPTFHPNPRLCVPRPLRFERRENPCRVVKADFIRGTAGYRSMIKRLQIRFTKLLVYDPTPVLCGETYCSALHDHLSMYSDSDHLSDIGADLVGKDLLKQIAHP